MTSNNKNFGARKQNFPFSLILIICLMVCLVGTTLAFFFATDWSSKYVTMSGKVDIEAVGGDGSSIEDVDNNGVITSKLAMSLQDNYKYLIPNMTISMPVNVKVYKSTTTPLLRAKFSLVLYSTDATGNETLLEGEDDEYNISSQMTDGIHEVVSNNGWLLNPADGYYYFIGNNEEKTPLTDTLLSEVDATSGDVIVYFVKTTDLIRFPKNVESTQSGLKIKFVVTFEAIQNYIPNSADGGKTKLPVTITNSKTIFDDDRDTTGGGEPSLTEEEIFQIYLNALENMSTTPSGGYVVNMTRFYIDNEYVNQADRVLYAYNGASHGSAYGIVNSNFADPNEECDIFSSDWEYYYSQKNGSDYVVNKVTEGSQAQITDSVSNLVSSANSIYSEVATVLKNGDLGPAVFDSFKDFYESYRSVMLEDYGFSEDVVNEGLYYTLSKSGGLYNFTLVADCAEYIDGVWTKVKFGAICTFNGNMVYRNYFEALEQLGSSPSSIDDSYRMVIDYSIESYSTKYKPDISEILKREEYNDILNSAVAKMNASNGFVMKQYYTRYLGSSDKNSQLQVYAYDGANYESAYYGYFNTDVVDYKDLSKAQLSEYDGFDYENGSLYYYNKRTYQYKYLATDRRKEIVANIQISNFNSDVNSLSDYVGSSFDETVSNLSSQFNTFFGDASVEKTITFTKNGDIYSLKIVGRGNGSLGLDEVEILLEFTENSIIRLIISAENNYPDKDNGKWIYASYEFEAYNTGSKPNINKGEFTLND